MSERNQAREMRIFEIAGQQTTVSVSGQQTRIGNLPVGIEPRAFQRLARRNMRSPLGKEMVASLGGRLLVIGVDRLDYSKGLIQRLDAFDHYLPNHRQWIDRGIYLQIPPKKRSENPEYSDSEK